MKKYELNSLVLGALTNLPPSSPPSYLYDSNGSKACWTDCHTFVSYLYDSKARVD